MGGGSDPQVVGYRYYVGMHQAICHGPADSVLQITVGEKEAWEGQCEGGQISILKPSLFGGDGREGGITGNVDILTGEPDQAANDYLEENVYSTVISGALRAVVEGYSTGDENAPSAIVPAFRGICSAVLRQVYVGINPYIKPWKWKVSRIHKTADGETQWYDAVSAIPMSTIPTAIYFALDRSGSMAEPAGDGHTRWENLRTAVVGVLEYIKRFLQHNIGLELDIDVTTFEATASSITRRGVTILDIDDIIAWIPTSTPVGGTDFAAALSGAASFFSGADSDMNRVIFFITDGEPSPVGSASTAAGIVAGISDVECYGVNISLENITYTAMVDNTDDDGVPIVSANDPTAILAIIIKVLGHIFDMNPAHIVRECFTSAEWGMGYPESEVDSDGTFTDSADTLFTEGMGLSILWDNATSIEDFIANVLQHIDGSVYEDRTTGKLCLKLVRDDYDEASLIELDESNILRLESFKRSTMADLVNEVVVKYWDGEDDEIKSVSVQNIALIQAMGRITSTTINYYGFTNAGIALRVALRDLKTLSTPGISGTLYVNRTAYSLNPGGCFKLSWADFGVSSVVMRVASITLGGQTNNEIKIEFTQDTFSTPEISIGATQSALWESQDGDPEAPVAQIAFELPYMSLVKHSGEDVVNTRLESLPEVGYLGAAAVRPNAISINAEIHTDSGDGYTEYGKVTFCPSATLLADIGYTATEITLENAVDVDLVTAGSWAQIDDELFVIDAIDETTATIRRGILDTVPAKHDAGARLYIWEIYTGSDGVEYVDSEEIDIKLLTVTGGGVLDIGDASAETVTMDSRAIRPYPPGNLQVNSESYPGGPLSGELTIVWAHRDRTQQTSGTYQDYSYGDIGPEAGVTYTVNCYFDDVLDQTENSLSGTSTTWTPSAEGLARVEVFATRDSYESWQVVTFEFEYSGSDVRLTETNDVRETEDDFGRDTEES